MKITKIKLYAETAASLIAAGTAICFCISIIYNYMYFSIIGLQMSSLPMTFMDHALAINSWLIMFIMVGAPIIIGMIIPTDLFSRHNNKEKNNGDINKLQESIYKSSQKLCNKILFLFILSIVANILIIIFISKFTSFFSITVILACCYLTVKYITKNIFSISRGKRTIIFLSISVVSIILLTIDKFKSEIYCIYTSDNIPKYLNTNNYVLRSLEKGVIVDTGSELRFILHDSQKYIKFDYTKTILDMKKIGKEKYRKSISTAEAKDENPSQ